MWNVIIIPMLPVMAFLEVTKMYIFQLTKCEQIGVSKSIDSDNRNFPSMKLQQILQFFQTRTFCFWSLLKRNRPTFQIF